MQNKDQVAKILSEFMVISEDVVQVNLLLSAAILAELQNVNEKLSSIDFNIEELSKDYWTVNQKKLPVGE